MAWTVKGSLRGPEGPQGPKGEDGKDGAGIQISGSVTNYAALPADLGPEDAGNAYLNDADGKLYVWNGTAWPADGEGVEFQGPKGDKGEQGERGPQGIEGPSGADGAAATIAVGTVTSGATGSTPQVINRGTPSAAIFDFVIPKGEKGEDGAVGVKGEDGEKGEDGTQWFVGEGSPSTIPNSRAGDLYLDTVSGTVYRLE